MMKGGWPIKIFDDRLASALFFALGLWVMIASVKISLGNIYNPGPGFVPFFLGLSMAGLSFLSFFSPDRQIPGDAFWNSWQKGKSVVYLFAALVIYLFLLKILGFWIDTFMWLAFLIKIAGAQGIRRPVLLSLFTMVILYFVFGRLLVIPFPVGALGF